MLHFPFISPRKVQHPALSHAATLNEGYAGLAAQHQTRDS